MYDIVYDIILHVVYDVVRTYDIVYDMQYNIVYDVVYYVVYDEHQAVYSCCLPAAVKRRCFKVSAPLRLDSETRDRRISSAYFTVIFLGKALP